MGAIREFTFLADGGFSVEGDGHRYPPPGLFGGDDGHAGRLVLNPGGRASGAAVQGPVHADARRAT